MAFRTSGYASGILKQLNVILCDCEAPTRRSPEILEMPLAEPDDLIETPFS